METRAHHVLIGSFALAVLVLAFLFVLWLGKLSLDREWAYYDVLFAEAVTGLTVGSAVQYNGIQVGEVRRLQLAPEDPSQVIAHIRVGSDTPVKTDTTAKLTFTGLTGVAIIQLGGGSAEAPRLEAPDNTVPRIVAEDSALAKLFASGEDVVLNVNQLMARASSLLSEGNVEKVSATLAHIESLSATLAEHGDAVGRALEDLSAAGQSLRTSLAQAEQLLQRLDSIAARADGLLASDAEPILYSLHETLEATRRLADSTQQLVEHNRAAIDRFGEQGLPQLAPTLAELRETLARLSALSQRIERDASGLLLGRDQPKEYDPR
ncbi:MlaD family protein [Aquimonas voraii]|uniref:Phospholipid/cholesterol/gamma-HCH transport system substrate-binding protein n=1 Tax=Aquimonas voraii TaxID=265719 RepID=A0A1G6SF10_9GAMM|nr:MlaD family protein [Aquimonas voraii]SDD15353.1 phospholipid/cholesterol/gamma-HCH transport system substrate-binding protein [Aquimonas voraii]